MPTTRYIRCQTCHKPVGNHNEANTGICYDCVLAAQNAERDLAQWYTCAITEATRQEVIGRSALSYGLAPNWNQLSATTKEAFRRLREKIHAEAIMSGQSDPTTETSTGYYAAYYRRRAADCRTWQEYAERHGDADSVAFYAMKAHDYDEAANAQER